MLRKKILIFVIALELVILIVFIYSQFIIPHWLTYPLMHDIAQDFIGAQALLDQEKDLYPILTSAFKGMGINWRADHQSTHPPTAYLFVIPFTSLNYPTAQMVWMVAMFGCIVCAFRVFSKTWWTSLMAGLLSLAWPPTIWSLGQITPIWLLGLALAYHYRNRPLASGMAIAVASLPKFMAAPALLYHLWRRKWSVFVGFVSVWLIALGVVLLLRPDAISAYLNANSSNSLEQILRTDNSALIVSAWRLLGWAGIINVALFILLVVWIGVNKDGLFGWACLVWLGIALLPIAWVYSILPLLPWLVIAVRSTRFLPRLLAVFALLLPYLAPIPTFTPWAITLSIFLAGISFSIGAIDKGSFNHKIIRDKL